mmetsp:Transcript_170887/g.543022  ORF Transcript_170887/g.543022 Transcript_170887/m.543022 type:complete len:102 (+) Transcript_170887:370-675(+)
MGFWSPLRMLLPSGEMERLAGLRAALTRPSRSPSEGAPPALRGLGELLLDRSLVNALPERGDPPSLAGMMTDLLPPERSAPGGPRSFGDLEQLAGLTAVLF